MIRIIARFMRRSNAGKNNQKSSASDPWFWKFNNSLLDNEEFVTRINLIHAKEKHRDTKGNRSYWEMIKLEIRDFFVFLSGFLKGKREEKWPYSASC